MTTTIHPFVIRGYIMLVLTALLWGTAFYFQKHGGAFVDAFTFNFLRFSVAIPALLMLFLLPQSLFEPDARNDNQKSALFIGVGAGFFMFLGISLQQLGLEYTTTGKSGFLTTLYIIFVPIVGILLKQHCRKEVWIGAILTLVGVFILNMMETGNKESDFNKGDVYTLICALGWAGQVIWLGQFAQRANVLKIAVIQVAVVAFLSAIVMLAQGNMPSYDVIWAIRWDILYTGVVSAGIAFTLQIFGQRYVPATNAALIMSSEAIFAMIVGVIFLKETVSSLGIAGCALIFVGIVIAQLQGKVFK